MRIANPMHSRLRECELQPTAVKVNIVQFHRVQGRHVQLRDALGEEGQCCLNLVLNARRELVIFYVTWVDVWCWNKSKKLYMKFPS